MIECMRTEARNLRFTEQRWISVKYHVMTEEERKAGGFSNDIVYYLDCKMPDDEQEIIVTDGRHVWVDTCIVNDGYALDSGHDWIEDVIAWMPLPEPYRETNKVLAEICRISDAHNIDRDSALKYFADMLTAFTEVATIQNYDSKQTNADRIRNMTDEELAVNMMCPNENGLAEIDCDKNDNCNCYECLLKWLRAEK